jgi:hypothetical protein
MEITDEEIYFILINCLPCPVEIVDSLFVVNEGHSFIHMN